MFEHRLAYRHTKHIEGYVGVGTTPDAAYRAALAKIRSKCEILNERFAAERLIITSGWLSPEVRAKIEADWAVSLRSTLT